MPLAWRRANATVGRFCTLVQHGLEEAFKVRKNTTEIVREDMSSLWRFQYRGALSVFQQILRRIRGVESRNGTVLVRVVCLLVLMLLCPQPSKARPRCLSQTRLRIRKKYEHSTLSMSSVY
jgi:hypothetical protein